MQRERHYIRVLEMLEGASYSNNSDYVASNYASKLYDLLDASLTPEQLRTLFYRLREQLRVNNRNRIAAQTTPDGVLYIPRKKRRYIKSKTGRRRLVPMFNKLRRKANLKAYSNERAAAVSFKGKVTHVARIHHYGLVTRHRISKRPVKYPARPLVGINNKDIAQIDDAVLDHLSGELL